MIDFAAALRHVLNGGIARRSGWPDPMYLDCLKNQYGKPTIIRQLSENSGHPFVAHQDDLLSEDWELR